MIGSEFPPKERRTKNPRVLLLRLALSKTGKAPSSEKIEISHERFCAIVLVGA